MHWFFRGISTVKGLGRSSLSDNIASSGCEGNLKTEEYKACLSAQAAADFDKMSNNHWQKDKRPGVDDLVLLNNVQQQL